MPESLIVDYDDYVRFLLAEWNFGASQAAVPDSYPKSTDRISPKERRVSNERTLAKMSAGYLKSARASFKSLTRNYAVIVSTHCILRLWLGIFRL